MDGKYKKSNNGNTRRRRIGPRIRTGTQALTHAPDQWPFTIVAARGRRADILSQRWALLSLAEADRQAASTSRKTVRMNIVIKMAA